MIVLILNGEAIPVVQTRVYDAGFDDLDIIPNGVDKVFIRSLSNSDVMEVFVAAQDFFNLFFTQPVRWDKNILTFERGAWVRIYGTLIHAWSESFFKLCVFNCGRFLRVDKSTLSKERFDYVRVLMATTSLEVLNFTDEILIDGVLVELKILEEWGFSIGEDACLLEDDLVSKVSASKNNFDHVAPDIHEHVEDLVNNLADDWALVDKDIHKQKLLRLLCCQLFWNM